MKHPSRFFTSPVALGVVVLVACGTPGTLAFARKKNTAISQLQIWPGQRALIVLPLKVNANFLNGDSESTTSVAPAPTAKAPAPDAMAPADGAPVSPGGDKPAMTAAPDAGAMAGVATSGQSELATALVPLVSGSLSRSLQNTGKFSLISPYRFDPLLRRALAEQQVSDDDITAFVNMPTLDAAQTMLPKLTLDQPGMVAQVALENLQVGGTPQAPTVQVRMHGDLYQVSPGATATDPPRVSLFRSITVTSRPFSGRTPEDRLRGATAQAFGDVAAAFVEPPAEFQLPLPIAPPAPAAGTAATGGTAGGSMSPPSKGVAPGKSSGGTMVPLTPAVPGAPTITPPGKLSPGNSGPIAPVLPPATPPLGLNVPTQGT